MDIVVHFFISRYYFNSLFYSCFSDIIRYQLLFSRFLQQLIIIFCLIFPRSVFTILHQKRPGSIPGTFCFLSSLAKAKEACLIKRGRPRSKFTIVQYMFGSIFLLPAANIYWQRYLLRLPQASLTIRICVPDHRFALWHSYLYSQF